MKTITKIIKKTKSLFTPFRLIVLGIIIAIVLWQVYKTEAPVPTYTVDTGVVERVVIASGKVEVSNQVDLGFQQAGPVARVLVKTGNKVSSGQMLAQLDLGTLSADLRDAKAGLAQAQYNKSKNQLNSSLSSGVLGVDTQNAAANLEALRVKLLSGDLELRPKNTDTNNSLSAPIVSGTYVGKGESATFTVSLYLSSGGSGVAARIIGDGVNVTIPLSTAFPTAIGTTGLYLQLPANYSSLPDSEWILQLPNTRSAQYASTLYQFLEAKKNYESTLNNQQKDISLLNKGYNGMTEYDIAIERARAAIDRVNQSIRQRGIYAPTAGTIGRIDLKLGQSASIGTNVITVLGSGELETKLKVPESSVGGIHMNDPVVVSPDIAAEDIYKGTISSIDQSETYVEGTPVYETTVVIGKPNNLKPGMTVRGTITTDKLPNALRVPELALFKAKDGSYTIKKVLKPDASDSVEVPVKVELRGTDGMVAIKADIAVGDKVQLQTEPAQ